MDFDKFNSLHLNSWDNMSAYRDKEQIVYFLNTYKHVEQQTGRGLSELRYMASKIRALSKTALPFSPHEAMYYIPIVVDFLRTVYTGNDYFEDNRDVCTAFVDLFEGKGVPIMINAKALVAVANIYRENSFAFLINENCELLMEPQEKKDCYWRYYKRLNLSLWQRERLLRFFWPDHLIFNADTDYDEEILEMFIRGRIMHIATVDDEVFFRMKYGDKFG